jgi:hypothetical protein
MRDLFAALAAVFLLLVALVLTVALQRYRYRRERARASEHAMGRRIVAELPAGADLVLVTEDAHRFYYGDREIDKDLIRAVRVLINGSPIAAYVSRRYPGADLDPPTAFEDRPEGIARDRWDVAVETWSGTILVECGAIRERVSQELARRIFDAMKAAVERLDATTPSQGSPRDDSRPAPSRTADPRGD